MHSLYHTGRSCIDDTYTYIITYYTQAIYILLRLPCTVEG